MSDTCTTCGQGLEAVDHRHTQPELDESNDENIDENEVVATRPFARRVLPVALIAAAVLGALLWVAFGGGADDTDRADDDAADLIEDDAVREISLTEVETRETVAIGGATGTVSYLSNDGLVLLNLESGEATIFGGQLEPVGFTGRLLLATDGEKTYRVDSQNPQALGTLSAFGKAVPTDISRIIHLTFEPSARPGRRSAMVMSLDGGVIGDAVPIPLGSQIEIIDHFGMVLIPPTGGTYLFDGDVPEQLSPNRVVAIAGNLRVELNCDDDLVCSPYLVREVDDDRAGVTMLSNIASRSEISLSPDGAYLLATHEGQMQGLRTDDLSAMSVGDAVRADADGRAAWARDSSQFAWLSSDGRVLTIAQPDGSEVARLDLRAIGLPAASGSSVALGG